MLDLIEKYLGKQECKRLVHPWTQNVQAQGERNPTCWLYYSREKGAISTQVQKPSSQFEYNILQLMFLHEGVTVPL